MDENKDGKKNEYPALFTGEGFLSFPLPHIQSTTTSFLFYIKIYLSSPLFLSHRPSYHPLSPGLVQSLLTVFPPLYSPPTPNLNLFSTQQPKRYFTNLSQITWLFLKPKASHCTWSKNPYPLLGLPVLHPLTPHVLPRCFSFTVSQPCSGLFPVPLLCQPLAAPFAWNNCPSVFFKPH